TIREIKFRPKIAQNDYETKKGHVTRFLKRKDKVKITIMFRGREVTHPERGQQLLERLAEELGELAIVEQRPNLDGRNMTMMLGPSKAILAGQLGDEDDEAADGADAPVADAEVTVDAAATNGAPADAGAADAPAQVEAEAGDAPAADATAPAADATAPADAADDATAPADAAPANATPAEPADAAPAPQADESAAARSQKS
ncbi:MAG: translation initiation factor, partial [Solirubrobacteraceae bacterium]|nr:translation initiation factor [Solirubrobacteraceae bacterium]